MTSPVGDRPPRRGWLERDLHDSCPPRKRELALALRALCRLLRRNDQGLGASDESAARPLTQDEVATRLLSNATSLSRFLNHDPDNPRVPDEGFVERLYKEACSDAATRGQDVGITREVLLDLRTSAEGERRGCRQCVELGKRIDSLTQGFNIACPSCTARQQRQQAADSVQVTSLKNQVAALRATVREMRTTEAGLQARLAAEQAARTPLPVPRQKRDRQRSKKEEAVAQQLARQAGELDSTGKPNLALTLLRQGTTELLTPAETAHVMVELRRHERDHLADNLIHVYGRDQGDRHIMAVALELHEEGAIEDAGAILRAALR
ncbi:hypothetical protein M2157_005957 [Streptomyces sp. SAI-127]|nr:hypothetical protein [Streptomyces sp. SAI-127]